VFFFSPACGFCQQMAPPGASLSRLLEHFRLAWSIYAAAELGLADAVGNEPRSAEELAASVGADATMSTDCCVRWPARTSSPRRALVALR
jgi:hypothetical protein